VRERPGPLTGVRIVDFTANTSGPFGTMILGDQGADVIKVEAPTGDVIRTIGTQRARMSGYFANLNRSKRSIALDLARPEARPVIDALLDSADVVVVNYRPGVAASLGLDAESVRRTRPQIIHAEVIGFADTGPYGGRPAYDHIIQALAGFVATQTDPKTGTPVLVRQAVVDKATGQVTAQAVTAALFERTRTGVGRAVQIRMLDVALAFIWPDGMMDHTLLDPEVVMPSIANSFRLTPTKDGHIAFIVATGAQWARLLAATGIDDGGLMGTMEGQMRHGGRFMRDVVAVLSRQTTDEVVDLLAGIDVPVAPVLRLDEVHDHPQVRADGAVDEFDHPVLGPVRQANPAVRFDGEHAAALPPAPVLGQHTDEVLAELGFEPAAIGRLRGDKVVR
jgi:crotonobetainyl-CoA:carnitine CoA-transferase CaiB-like acyl-CoA transferase